MVPRRRFSGCFDSSDSVWVEFYLMSKITNCGRLVLHPQRSCIGSVTSLRQFPSWTTPEVHPRHHRPGGRNVAEVELRPFPKCQQWPISPRPRGRSTQVIRHLVDLSRLRHLIKSRDFPIIIARAAPRQRSDVNRKPNPNLRQESTLDEPAW